MPLRSRLIGDIAVFLVLAFGLSTLFHALILSHSGDGGSPRQVMIGLMWAPGVAALLTVRLRGLELASLGWGWGAHRWNLIGYILPLGYAGLAYAMIWLSGAGAFAGPAEIAGIASRFGWGGASGPIVLIGFVLLQASAGVVIAVSSALGEEIGWRGFLTPRVAALAGFTGSALIVGVVWAVWHLPLLLFGNYNSGTEWWVATACFSVLALSASVVLTWLRQRSGSLWPCAIFHASHNLFIQGVFTPLTGTREGVTPYVAGEFGIATPAVLLLVAIAIWLHRRPRPDAAPESRELRGRPVVDEPAS